MVDTIFAVSSGAGRAGVAVIRVSGPGAAAALGALAGRLPGARRAAVRALRDPRGGAVFDHALVLWLPGPASFTGEDVAELHVHGGRAVIAAALSALGAVPGLRPAEPGEFTRRAFAGGRLDLVEVEGLGDLVAADTAMQLRAALRTASGQHRAMIAGWKEGIVRAMALIEASIDFSDEADVPADLAGDIGREIDSVREQIGRHLSAARAAERLRDGVQVVIAGPPNAGKSTLMNALAGREVAIVSAEAGTTRDVIEVALDLGGCPLVLADTAGLRDDAGGVEGEGVRRARARAESADLVLWLEAPDARASPPAGTGRVWRVATKADAGAGAVAGATLAISARTGAGIDELLARLGRFARDTIGGEREGPLFVRERQRQSLARCSDALDAARARLGEGSAELAAEDMRQAARALAAMVGEVDVENLLDVIFREFCIGK